MSGLFKDYEHLVRVAVLLLIGVVVFFVVAGLAIPKGFGEYGHFRGPALGEISARPLAYAGHAACEECHSDVAASRKGSRHAKINCETCHGALAAHAADPTSGKPVRPDKRDLCIGCHAASSSRPNWLPQVDVKDHAPSGDCTECHPHHHPKPGSTP